MDTKPILSVIGTVKSRLPDLSIKNGQLIFIQDSQTIALDLNGKRTFYNEIITMDTEEQRQSILAPIQGVFYFVQKTYCIWTYDNEWKQLTSPPHEVIVNVDSISNLPSVGNEICLYIVKNENKTYRWDDVDIKYYCIGSDYNDIKTIDGGSA